jgi:hypothetical protein
MELIFARCFFPGICVGEVNIVRLNFTVHLKGEKCSAKPNNEILAINSTSLGHQYESLDLRRVF